MQIKKNINILLLLGVLFYGKTHAQTNGIPKMVKDSLTHKKTITSLVHTLSEVSVSFNDTRQGESKMDMMAMQLQPVKSAQDLLRMVPGLFIAQHAGGGKAEQIFVRGNDNDHGTDFGVFFDGIPVNLPTHAHGQGYADMHFMITEMIGKASFFKGPYEASLGDFSISGAAFFNSKYMLDKNVLKMEYGLYNSPRTLLMLNLLNKKHLIKKFEDKAYIASEYAYNDGYFQNKLNFKRFNIFGRYNARLSEKTDLMFSTSFFSSNWNASGQLPQRAVEAGWVDRLGSIDPSEGGITSRTNLNLKIHTQINNNAAFNNQVYYSKNIFTLFSDFTFFMNDTVNGDEIKQWENRDMFGYKGTYTRSDSLGKTALGSEIGFTTRTDILSRGRDHVKRRDYLGIEANDNAHISNYSFYANENWRFHPKWNLNVGLRNDLFDFNLQDRIRPINSGKKWVYRLNPKLNLYYDISDKVTVYAKSGIGFHSNFVQAVLSKDATANPVPQSYGADLGTNLKLGKKAVISIAGWWLHVGSEYRFKADDGSFENIGDARKYGIDLSARYLLVPVLWADINLNFARGILINAPANANLLPLHPTWNSTGGLTLSLGNGLNASIRYRYMGERPATEDGLIKAKRYFIVDAVIKYMKPKYELALSAENVLNTKWVEAQFYDQSRLRNETAPVMDFHVTPGTPFYLKASVSYLF
jgi:outer membrane receptor protein involved in Fe transport